MKTISRRRMLGFTAVGLLGVAGAPAISSCAARGTGSGIASGELTLMIWDAHQEAGVQKAVDAFMKANPGYKVRLDVVPEDQYYTKLDAALGARSGPDIMWQSSKAVDYVNGGALEPLDEYIDQNGVDLTQYAPSISKLYNFEGKQYGLPKDMDAWVFIYNTEIFSKYKVQEPTPEWTWDEMLLISDQLVRASGKTEQAVFYSTSLFNGVADLVKQLGGDVISDDGKAGLDSEVGRKAFRMLMDLVDKGYAPDTSKKADFAPLSALLSGNLAMSAVPSWNVSAVSKADAPAGTFKAVRFPSVNGSYVTDTNGLSYTMNAFSQDKPGAFKLIQFLTSLEGAKLHAQGGAGLPAIAAAQDDWFSANGAVANISAFKDAAAHTFLRPSSAFPAARPAVSKVSATVMPNIWARRVSIDEGVQQIDEAIQAALK